MSGGLSWLPCNLRTVSLLPRRGRPRPTSARAAGVHDLSRGKYAIPDEAGTPDGPQRELRPEGPSMKYTPSEVPPVIDPYYANVLRRKLPYSGARGLEVKIGSSRGFLDSVAPSINLLNVQEMDISWELCNASDEKPISLAEAFEHHRRELVQSGDRLDLLVFSSCFGYFANVDNMERVRSFLKPDGHLLFYMGFDPELQKTPFDKVRKSLAAAQKMQTRYRPVEPPARSRVRSLLRELTSKEGRAGKEAIARQMLDEFVLQYGIRRDKASVFGPSLANWATLSSIEASERDALSTREMRKLRYSDDTRPPQWQTKVAEVLRRYERADSRNTSLAWRDFLVSAPHGGNRRAGSQAAFYRLSALFRMPVLEYCRMFSVRIDVRDILVMWQDNPGFWHIDEPTASRLKAEIQSVLEQYVSDKDIDERGRVRMVHVSYLGILKNVGHGS